MPDTGPVTGYLRLAAMSCMHAEYQTVNSRSESHGIIIGGGSGSYSRPSRGSHYLVHKLLLLNHQVHMLNNPTLRYVKVIIMTVIARSYHIAYKIAY